MSSDSAITGNAGLDDFLDLGRFGYQMKNSQYHAITGCRNYLRNADSATAPQ